jgi:mRNA interferase HigB
MKVHLIRKETLEEFATRHPASRPAIKDWLSKLKYADWDEPQEIKKTFGTAEILGNNTSRVVFNLGGNNLRMICKYGFGRKEVHLFILWIDTHAEYTKLCNKNEQYTVTIY